MIHKCIPTNQELYNSVNAKLIKEMIYCYNILIYFKSKKEMI